jgi:hypothetical protein
MCPRAKAWPERHGCVHQEQQIFGIHASVKNTSWHKQLQKSIYLSSSGPGIDLHIALPRQMLLNLDQKLTSTLG